MGFHYVEIIKIIGKQLICHFFDDFGSSYIEPVWSRRLLKKRLKKDSTLKLVNRQPIVKFNNMEIKEYKLTGFLGEE